MAERAALLSSTSWRLTAPLRAASDRIPPHPPGPTSAAENLSRRTPPPLAASCAWRANPAISRTGAVRRSEACRGRRGDPIWGVISRLIVQAKKLSRFMFPGPRQLAYIRKVQASGLFDPDFYTTHHPGMRWIFRRFPVRHYVTIGEREHLRPNPDFSGSIYLRYNPDVRQCRRPALPALRRDRTPRDPGHKGATRARAGTGASDAACRRRPGRHCGPRCGGACLLP